MKRTWPIVVALLAMTSIAKAQSAEPFTAEEPRGYVVIGLADNDLLNLRATASANGMLIARVPAGTLLRGHGCAEVSGNRWCKVSEADNPTVMGWAAERYLQANDAEFTEPSDPEPAEEPGEMIGPVEGENSPG